MELKVFTSLRFTIDLLLTVYYKRLPLLIITTVLFIVTGSLDDNGCIEAIFRHGYAMYLCGGQCAALLCLLNCFRGDE